MKPYYDQDGIALVEAIKEWSYSYESLEPVLAVARAFRDAPSAWYCWKHDKPSTDMECQDNGMGQQACEVGRVRYVPEVYGGKDA